VDWHSGYKALNSLNKFVCINFLALKWRSCTAVMSAAYASRMGV
jgi:hypothetical protein